MLVIRLQRTGRKGHAMFRIVVQDSRRSPSSGSVVAFLGNYDPHNKKVSLDKEKASYYIEHGAQPSDRMIGILKSESVKLPKWAVASPTKKKVVRNPEKRRSTAPEPAEKPAESVEPEPTDKSEEVEQPVDADQPEASEQPVEETKEASDDQVEESKEPEAEPEEPAEAAKSEESTPEAESSDSEDKPEAEAKS